MAKRIMIILLQTLLICAFLFSGYYFLYLKPNIKLAKNKNEAVKILTIHKNTLTQNRIAFVGLTKLDPDSPTFSLETSNLLGALEKSQTEGIKLISELNSIPETKILSDSDFSILLTKTENIYKTQQDIVEKIKSTKSYKEGLEVLESDDSINLLTSETNIILEYQYWTMKIDDFQK